MGRRIALCAVVVLANALSGSSSASANWTTNGTATGMTVEKQAGPALLSVTQNGVTQAFSCSAGVTHGDVLGGGIGGDALEKITTTRFTGCTGSGTADAIHCVPQAAKFDGVSYTPATSVTSGTLSGIECKIVKLNGACGNATTFNATGSASGAGITLTGSLPATYGNTSQQLQISATGQTLNVTWSSPGCLQGTGTGGATGKLTNSSGTALAYTVTSAFKPQITN
jgi:hypothetical protein